MKTAIFIGGAYDMTKRIIESTPIFVTFFEPLNYEAKRKYNDSDSFVECRVLEYKKVYESPNKLAIYEYQGIKK